MKFGVLCQFSAGHLIAGVMFLGDKMDYELKVNYENKTKIKAPCSRCSLETNHRILTDVELEGHQIDEDGFLIYGTNDNFQTIQCLGCDHISFRQSHINSEDDWIEETSNGIESVPRLYQKFYPKPEDYQSRLPELALLPNKIKLIYEETLVALNSDQKILTGIGIRAIIETVCKDRKADGKDLYRKINNLVEQSILTKDGAEILHKLRVLGNSAAHEVMPHEKSQLKLAFEVIDHLLQGVYVFPIHTKEHLPS